MVKNKLLDTQLSILLNEKREYINLIDESKIIIENLDRQINKINIQLKEKPKKEECKIKPIDNLIKLAYPTEENLIAIYNIKENKIKLFMPSKDLRTMTLQKRFTEFFSVYNIDLEMKGELNKETGQREFCKYLLKEEEKIDLNKDEIEISLD